MKLEVGYKHDFEVREEFYFHPKATEDLSILYCSDLHLNKWSAPLIENLIQTISSLNPTLILLGGDYVDTKKGFEHLTTLFRFLSTRNHAYIIAGNHDYFRGLKTVKKEAIKHELIWLDKRSKKLSVSGLELFLTNVEGSPLHQPDLTVHCLHKPKTIALDEHHHLIFAGHLHGSQLVFWENVKGLYPGRWVYKWNKLRQEDKNQLYLISKGLGDTLPLRYNCNRDVIFTTIKTKN